MLFNISEPYAKQKEEIRGAFILAATGEKQVAGARPGTFKHVDIPWPLPNMKPITEVDFWNYRSTHSFAAEVWNQLYIDGLPVTGLLYFVIGDFHGPGGFAVITSRDKVEYYKWIACEHDFVYDYAGRCLTNYTCTKCGHKFQVDSSD